MPLQPYRRVKINPQFEEGVLGGGKTRMMKTAMTGCQLFQQIKKTDSLWQEATKEVTQLFTRSASGQGEA